MTTLFSDHYFEYSATWGDVVTNSAEDDVTNKQPPLPPPPPSSLPPPSNPTPTDYQTQF